MMTGRQLRRPRHASLLAGFAALLLAGTVNACASGPPRAGSFTAGVSGRPPTPLARPGQTLPLVPSRQISFETTRGTDLALDVSPDGARVIFDMLGDIYAMPAGGGRAEALTRYAAGIFAGWKPNSLSQRPVRRRESLDHGCRRVAQPADFLLR